MAGLAIITESQEIAARSLLGDGLRRSDAISRVENPAKVTLRAYRNPDEMEHSRPDSLMRQIEDRRTANEECRAVVLRWCGLRDYNAVGRFSSLTSASECVRVLAAKGFTETSISTVALIGGERIDALVGIHSDDLSRVDQASAVMRAVNARVCFF